MKPTPIQLSEIVTTAGTQIRAADDASTVDEYALAMRGGAEFPPLVVFHDGSRYILADGFHRVLAATRNGETEFACDVRKGTKSDALKFALGANSAHGLPRTNRDKRRSVTLALEEWPKMSSREIAKICAVDDHTVSAVRKEIESTAEVPQLPARIGADGKERKLPIKRTTPEPRDIETAAKAQSGPSLEAKVEAAKETFAASGITPEAIAAAEGPKNGAKRIAIIVEEECNIARERILGRLEPGDAQAVNRCINAWAKSLQG